MQSTGIVIKITGEMPGKEIASLEDASKLGAQVLRYRELLAEIGMSVPGSSTYLTCKDEKDRPLLILMDSFVGESASIIIKETDSLKKVIEITRAILDATEPIFSSGTNKDGFWLIGFDPKTSNFVYNGGICYYVDFMPPRYFDGESFLIEYPMLYDQRQIDFWKWKYFTPEGVMSILLYQLGRLRVEHFASMKKTFLRYLRQKGRTNLLKFFKVLDDPSAHIDSCSNPLILRLLMCELCSRVTIKLSAEVLEQFFQRTHYEGDIPPDDLAWAQETLKTVARLL